MCSATCSIRFFSLVAVKFLSRVLTALNLLPSTAASAWVKSPIWRHSATKCAHDAWIAGP